jgi:hypothetical protein
MRRAHADWVSSINAAADTNGIQQTPTMLINGKEVEIASLTPESLQTMINNAAQKVAPIVGSLRARSLLSVYTLCT